jgi:hypothetical protein
MEINMKELTERRKADRAKMATIIAEIAREYGATAEIKPEGSTSYRQRRIMVKIVAQRGLCLNLDFDGQSVQPDIHVMSWHFNTDTDTCLSDKFGVLGSINPYHFRKATYIGEGFKDLCFALRYGLELAQNGEAFDEDREVAAIAKDGTAAERAARWNAYFDSMRAAA